jgi:hypothetical protein
LGIGDWGLGIGPNPQSPIPNPQSPIPNPQIKKQKTLKKRTFFYKIFFHYKGNKFFIFKGKIFIFIQ